MAGKSHSDKDLKDAGNKHFSARNYDSAIECYTQAILKNPAIPHYYTNRALCYLNQKRWDLAVRDAKQALEKDANLVKGHFYLGKALLEKDHLDDSIKHLQRASDLAKEQKLNFGDDIAVQLRIVRKKRWNIQEEKRIHQEIELQTYLNRLILEDKERKADELRHTGQDVDVLVEKVEHQAEDRLAEVNALFAKVDERRQKRDVPDYLCGKISFEVLKDPVITPSGITYDRKDIEEHLHRVGHFDPVTRTKLTQDQLIHNYAMKEVVDNFIMENEWALDY
ncbi:E3 ubiquitin-protein ligase CHIP-like [Tigriopus californicus]|uniref:E3 ubiquitin-protein ligase CHIP-like n=1 Tax=Tigriopus californicus TaxID=6832 RepID=UPI0027DA8C80|nr:E3 ubiquitin-protein ligase CHIP-like [Tigriopus californicus]